MPRCDVKWALPCSQSWRRGSSVGRASCLRPFHPDIKQIKPWYPAPKCWHASVATTMQEAFCCHVTYRLSLGVTWSNPKYVYVYIYIYVCRFRNKRVSSSGTVICVIDPHRDMQHYCSSSSVEQNPNLTLIWLCFPLGWADQMWWPPLCPERPRGRTDSSGYLREVVCSVRAHDELFLSWEWVSRTPGTCKQTKTINTSTRPCLRDAIQSLKLAQS